MNGDYMNTKTQSNYVLIPRVYNITDDLSPTTVVALGMFSLVFYLESSPDPESDTQCIFACLAIEDSVVQTHIVGVLEHPEAEEVETDIATVDTIAVIQGVTNTFIQFLIGGDADFPILRARGWQYTSEIEIAPIMLHESRLRSLSIATNPEILYTNQVLSEYDEKHGIERFEDFLFDDEDDEEDTIEEESDISIFTDYLDSLDSTEE